MRLLKEEVPEVTQIAWRRLGKKSEGLQEAELQDHRGTGACWEHEDSDNSCTALTVGPLIMCSV